MQLQSDVLEKELLLPRTNVKNLQESSSTDSSPHVPSRLPSIDVFRGLIICLMAWGYCKNELWEEADPEYSLLWSGAFESFENRADLFFAEFVSYIAPPAFFWLMGIGMNALAEHRQSIGWTNRKLVKHFASRGVIFIVLDRIVNMAYFMLQLSGSRFPDSMPTKYKYMSGLFPVFGEIGVLSCLGLVMLLIAAYMPLYNITRKYTIPVPPYGRFAGCIVVAACDLLNVILSALSLFISTFAIQKAQGLDSSIDQPFPRSGAAAKGFVEYLLRILVYPGLTDGGGMLLYSVFPWIALTFIGISCTSLFRKRPQRARLLCFIVGGILLVIFVWIRYYRNIGNLRDGGRNQNIDDVLAFFNVCVFPPSLSFLCLTMGVNLIILSAMSFVRHPEDHLPLIPLLCFGRTPLLFYVLFWWLLQFFNVLVRCFRRGLPICILPVIWVALLVIMFPISRKYDRWKRTRSPESSWRML